MGIRFYCPNGHRLHVKSFLAGKRGICPECSARFRIPAASEIPQGSPRLRSGPEAASAAVNTAEPDEATALATEEETSQFEPLPKPTTEPSPAADPISEAPNAVWYVRPPSGGQFGPAQGEVMQRWLTEGRVSPDTLVWREGWPDWRLASTIFSALAETPAADNAATEPPPESAAQSAPRVTVNEEAESFAARHLAARRNKPTSSRAKSIAAVVTLISAAVVLLIILMLILQGRA